MLSAPRPEADAQPRSRSGSVPVTFSVDIERPLVIFAATLLMVGLPVACS
jgi:hypothetical protein